MGDVHNVLAQANLKTDQWPYNGRLVIEDCETVHIHFNNIRIEFHREQFLQLVEIGMRAANTLRAVIADEVTTQDGN